MTIGRVSPVRLLGCGLAVCFLLVASACGGHKPAKVPSSFDNANTGKTRYQMALETDDGSVIELNTGSLWVVADSDQLTVLRHWSLDSNLVELGDDGHTLINAEAANTHNVRATRVGNATDHKLYRKTGDKTIGGIGHGEYFGGAPDGSVLSLTDGSVWSVSDPTDQVTAVDWADGDDVVVARKHVPAGINGGPFYTLTDTDVESSITATFAGGG